MRCTALQCPRRDNQINPALARNYSGGRRPKAYHALCRRAALLATLHSDQCNRSTATCCRACPSATGCAESALLVPHRDSGLGALIPCGLTGIMCGSAVRISVALSTMLKMPLCSSSIWPHEASGLGLFVHSAASPVAGVAFKCCLRFEGLD